MEQLPFALYLLGLAVHPGITMTLTAPVILGELGPLRSEYIEQPLELVYNLFTTTPCGLILGIVSNPFVYCLMLTWLGDDIGSTLFSLGR